MDADADGALVPQPTQGAPRIRDRLYDGQARMHGTLGVALMPLREAEIDHHPIPEGLGDETSKGADRIRASGLKRAHELGHILDVALGGHRRRVHEVAEQDGDQSPLTRALLRRPEATCRHIRALV